MQNMGRAERIMRAILGAGFLVIAFYLEGNWSSIAVLGILPLATAVLGICPFKLLAEADTEMEPIFSQARPDERSPDTQPGLPYASRRPASRGRF